MNIPSGNIIISRTDAIGDVILTLPLVGFIKKLNPKNKIIFLGRTYTKPIIEKCRHVDFFLNWDEISSMDNLGQIDAFKKYSPQTILFVFPDKQVAHLANKVGIPIRVGTAHRWYHWLFANRRPFFSRRNSNLHEAQLNFQLLKTFGDVTIPNMAELYTLTGIESDTVLPESLRQIIDANKFNLILHPRSRGSSREWGLKNFEKLLWLLSPDKFKIFITGTKAEGESMANVLAFLPKHCVDLTGKMTLEELIDFIGACDGIVACSTGPLHIGAVLGKHAIGLYPPMRPLHPGRWEPIGPHTFVFCIDKKCDDCRKGGACACIGKIDVWEVAAHLELIQK